MKHKGFAPIVVILVLMVALAAVVGLWLNNARIGKKGPIESSPEQKLPESEAVSVVKNFCDNFFKGPPAINEQGVMVAYGLISQKGKDSMTVIGPSPSASVASFSGVTNVPDQGYSIDGVSEVGEKATVKTTWKYSSGAISKTFDLEKENGTWKINSIN